MSAAPAQPRKQPRNAKVFEAASKIKHEIDQDIEKMNAEPQFSPTRGNLESRAEEVVEFIDTYHSEIVDGMTYLKAALIDLTEAPEMAPQMQRISFMTALKDASRELSLFLETC